MTTANTDKDLNQPSRARVVNHRPFQLQGSVTHLTNRSERSRLALVAFLADSATSNVARGRTPD